MLRELKMAGTWFAISLGFMLLLSIAYKSPYAIVAITLGYAAFILLPGYVWAYPLKQTFVQTFLLANIIGFAWGAAYVPLDIFLRVPLNPVTFIVVTMASVCLGLYINRGTYFGRQHHPTLQQSTPEKETPVNPS
jgi:hypothetical protein